MSSDLGLLDLHLALLFQFASHFLLFLSLSPLILLLKPVFLFLELSFTRLFSLFLLKIGDQALSRDRLALVTLPDAIGHAFQLCTEQMERLLTTAAVDEVAWILALKAIVWILRQIETLKSDLQVLIKIGKNDLICPHRQIAMIEDYHS